MKSSRDSLHVYFLRPMFYVGAYNTACLLMFV